ncbi:MAG TPA: SCO1664 family protein [Anaerolineae bacterium]|nr:SCO1664 family protein [Anaerolineae bacterium]
MARIKRRFSVETVLTKIETVRRLAASRCEDPDCDTACLTTLLTGQLDLQGLMPWSSNYTFLVALGNGEANSSVLAIYKPGDGERPLWDFPDRTLCNREFASYLVSQVLGWPSIPTTVLRDGPHGIGSVQRFIDADYEAHYFNMRELPGYQEEFRRLALFDYVVNNADRKGGHCLKGKDGRLWAIDHGLTFHSDPKLRTVIWEFGDQTIPDKLRADLIHLHMLMEDSELCAVLADLIAAREVEAFRQRLKNLTSSGRFPTARYGRSVPYPPI